MTFDNRSKRLAVGPLLCYSLRSAMIGSTRIARNAGTRQAANPVMASAAATAA